MKEQKRKYDRPLMERVLVELEDGFCTASVVTTQKNKVETTGHELNDIDLGNESWNSTPDGKNGWE